MTRLQTQREEEVSSSLFLFILISYASNNLVALSAASGQNTQISHFFAIYHDKIARFSCTGTGFVL